MSKEAQIAIRILDKIDLKTQTVTRDKEEYYIIINGTIQQEDLTTVNIYAPNMGVPKYKTVNNIKKKSIVV